VDTTYMPAPHTWEHHRLAAQILRSWVREVTGDLPAWTTPGIVHAYARLLESLDALIRATQQAEREASRHA
jgi:hypothetical protein